MQATGDAVLVGVGDVPVVGILDIAFAFADRQVGAVGQQAVHDRAAGGEAALYGVLLAQRQRPRRIRRERWAARGDVDHADTGVLAQQRALRAARYFHRIDVGEVEAGGQGVVGVVDAIDDQANARILRLGLALLADAANGQAGGALVTLVPRDIGGALGQGLDVGGLQAIQFLARDDGDRQRHVLQALQPVAAAHRYLAQRLWFLSGRRRFDGGNSCCRCAGGGRRRRALVLRCDDLLETCDFRLQLGHRGVGGVQRGGGQQGSEGEGGAVFFMVLHV